MNQKLENATKLYMEGIRDGNARQAVTQYTGQRYTQHSTGVRNGVEGFVEFFEPFLAHNPVRDIQIVRSVVDGQYVFVQASQDLNNGQARWLTTDLFDTDEQDTIIEHWDVISPLNTEHQVDGPTEIQDLAATEDNKAIVRNFLCEVMVLGQTNDLAKFINQESLVVHALTVLEAWQDDIGTYHEVFKLIGQGNFVVAYNRVMQEGQEWARFDLFRLRDRRIEEWWVNQEAVPPKEEWVNGGKF